MEYARSKAPQPVNRTGVNLAGPTLLAHGSDEQKHRWLPGILSAEEIWCQLFSEPGAGSDLASLSTRATPTDDGWVLQGQKVWTSYAQFSRWGIALVRTDPDAPRHRGISYVVVDMEAPGVEVRPLVTMTAEAEFNEVFFDEVFVPHDHLIGGLNNGWAVANTTLAHERGTTFPFKEQVVHEVYLDELLSLAEANGSIDEPLVADELVDAYVLLRVLRLHNWRTMTRLTQRRGARPGVERRQARVVRHDPPAVRRRARRRGRRLTAVGPVRRQPGGREVAASVAVEQGLDDRRRDLRGAAHDHRRAPARPPALTLTLSRSGSRLPGSVMRNARSSVRSASRNGQR